MTTQIEKAMAEAGREAHADRVLRLDRLQSSPAGKICPADPNHGRMGVHRDGTILLCTHITKFVPGNVQICGATISVTLD